MYTLFFIKKQAIKQYTGLLRKEALFFTKRALEYTNVVQVYSHTTGKMFNVYRQDVEVFSNKDTILN